MRTEDWKFADEILLKVSRTFALNINVLAGEPRDAILLAYLYMRIADTIEDDPDMKASEKEVLLGKFAAIFEVEEAGAVSKLSDFLASIPEAWRTSDDFYHVLVRNTYRVVPLLCELSEPVVLATREAVCEMCAGMAKFALRQEESLAGGWFMLETVGDLEEYCYYVAGLVGRFLSKVFYEAVPGLGGEAFARMKQLDLSFGLALQITNIVKDVREDATRKVCFVPNELCRQHGFANSSELFAEGADPEARAAAVHELCARTWGHVADGVEYTLLIPRRQARIRLFCLWPLMMAAENLRKLGDCKAIFESEGKVKITRADVKRILRTTSFHFYSDSWIRKTFAELAK